MRAGSLSAHQAATVPTDGAPAGSANALPFLPHGGLRGTGHRVTEPAPRPEHGGRSPARRRRPPAHLVFGLEFRVLDNTRLALRTPVHRPASAAPRWPPGACRNLASAWPDPGPLGRDSRTGHLKQVAPRVPPPHVSAPSPHPQHHPLCGAPPGQLATPFLCDLAVPRTDGCGSAPS